MSSAGQGQWRSSLLRTPANAPFIHWLRDRGSLTARIQARGRFAVRVLRQGLGLPTADEARRLGIEPGVLAWIREVALLCDEQLVVFAHTVLPRRPRGPLHVWLARLGNRSLGALLFAHPGFRRGQINFKRLDRRHALFAPALHALQLTGRRYRHPVGASLALPFWRRNRYWSAKCSRRGYCCEHRQKSTVKALPEAS
jgi:chorismate--pyruvate lyase